MSITEVSITNLKDHPRNKELFDDIVGEKWEEFKRDIASTHGAREPIVISSDGVIISGHQRVRAHRELGLWNIAAETINYNGDEEAMLHDLIALNVQQRGLIGGSADQMNERRKVMENWYNHRENAGLTQAEIAIKAGMTPAQASTSKSIMNVVEEHPDLKEASRNGLIAESAILNIAHQNKEVQNQVVASLDLDKRVTIKNVQAAIDEATGKAENERQKAEKEIQGRIEEATASIVAEHLEVISRKDEEIKELQKENARIKSSSKRHRQLEKIASKNDEGKKRERGKMAYELCQEEEFGGPSNSEPIDELTFMLKGYVQNFVDGYTRLMMEEDFMERFSNLSTKDRNDLNTYYLKTNDIISTLLSK